MQNPTLPDPPGDDAKLECVPLKVLARKTLGLGARTSRAMKGFPGGKGGGIRQEGDALPVSAPARETGQPLSGPPASRLRFAA
jgi:hypothetical protein